MSEENEEITPITEVEKPISPPTEIQEVTVRGYPKTVLFYPMAFISVVIAAAINLLAFIYLIPDPNFYWRLVYTLTFIWFVLFLFNLLLVTFDIGKNIIVAIALIIVIVILALALYITGTGVFPFIDPSFLGLYININSMFAFFIIFLFVIFIAWIRARIYYFRITSNEIVYKKGILGDVERFGTTNVMFHKEICDIFEYLLLRSGRLTFTIPGRKTTVVLDTVPNVNKVEQQILLLLRRIEVDLD
ncbi:MAG: hypothetical protein ACFFDJ_06050 [Candidatus Odinarchaeota archaeon]